jgi:hypothetical protein
MTGVVAGAVALVVTGPVLGSTVPLRPSGTAFKACSLTLAPGMRSAAAVAACSAGGAFAGDRLALGDDIRDTQVSRNFSTSQKVWESKGNLGEAV